MNDLFAAYEADLRAGGVSEDQIAQTAAAVNAAYAVAHPDTPYPWQYPLSGPGGGGPVNA
jgi:hypothetical protein